MKTSGAYYVCCGAPLSGDGSAANPFPTLQHARDALRALKTSNGLPPGAIDVVVRAGVISSEEPSDWAVPYIDWVDHVHHHS